MPANETAPWFDLQSHSTYSDGTLPPAEVVHRAEQAGVRLLALTDHDTVDGVNEALQAARTVKIVPAVELSSVHNDFEDLHILGYGLDHTDPDLLATLEDFRGDRVRRIEAMADNLRAEGFTIELPEHKAPGRPHLAKAMQGQTDLTHERDLRQVPDPRHAHLRRALPAHGPAGDRRHPRGRRRRRLGAPVLGHGRGAGHARPVRGLRDRRRGGVLRHPQRGADARATRRRARARPADHRLRGLPRAHA